MLRALLYSLPTQPNDYSEPNPSLLLFLSYLIFSCSGSSLGSMASFADLVHPLPLVALPLLVVALERGGPSGFAREAASLLRQHEFAVPPDLILDNILAKLQAGLLLPRESNVPVDVPCNVVGCPDCGVVLPPGTIHETRVLQWPGGFKTGTYEQKRCERCGCVFLSCWMRSPAGTLSMVSPPEMCCYWLLVNHPKTTTFSFVATSLLRHCTSLVVRLRATFLAFANSWATWRAILHFPSFVDSLSLVGYTGECVHFCGRTRCYATSLLPCNFN